MRRSLLFSILIYSLLLTSLYAQQPDTVWTRTFGGLSLDHAFELHLDENDDLLIAGYLTEDAQRKYYMVKTNSDGDTLWTFKYDGGSPSIGPVDIELTSDGGYIMLGYIDEDVPFPIYADIQVVKLDAARNIEWQTTFGELGVTEGLSDIIQRPDGGYFIVGDTWTQNSTYSPTLYSISALGVFEWREFFHYEDPASERVHDIAPTSDGGFVITGRAQDINSSYAYDTFILKVNSLGDSLWTKTHGLPYPYDETGKAIVETSDGGFLIAGEQGQGTTSKECELIKTDANGDLEWNHVFGGTYNDVFFDAIETSDDGFAACGTHHIENWKSLIIRYDVEGDTLWSYRWGDDDHSYYSYSIGQLSDGDFILLGTKTTGTSSSDIMLARIHEFPVGLQEFNEIPQLTIEPIIPNPAQEQFRLSFEIHMHTFLRIHLMDSKGTLVKRIRESNIAPGTYQQDVGIQDLMTGLYFCRFEVDGRQLTKKIQIER